MAKNVHILGEIKAGFGIVRLFPSGLYARAETAADCRRGAAFVRG